MTALQFATQHLTGFVTEKTVDLAYRMAQFNGKARTQGSYLSLQNQTAYYQQILQMLINPEAPAKSSTYVKKDWLAVVGTLIQFVQNKINDCQYWLHSNTSTNPANVDYQAKLVVFQSFKTQLSYLKNLP